MAKIPTNVTIVASDVVAHQENVARITLCNTTTDGVPGETVVVTIKDEYGNVLVDGKPYYTGDAGFVDVPFTPFTNGSVNITVSFDGNVSENVYLASTNSSNGLAVRNISTSMNVSATNTSINGTSIVTVNITDVNGNAVNGSVVLSFSDGTGNVTINLDGVQTQVTHEFGNTTVGKDVVVTATFVPKVDSGFDAVTNTANFNVARINTTVTIVSGSPVCHNETTATITLFNYTNGTTNIDSSVPGEELNITIVQDGNELPLTIITNVTDGNGVVTVKYTPLTGSPVNITAEYVGGAVYNGNSTSVLVTPSKIGTALVLNSTDTQINGTSVVGINVTDDNGNPVNGTVRLVFNDSEGVTVTVDVHVEDGFATFDYTNTTVGKNVTVKGEYLVNDTFGYEASNEVETDFNVAKINTTTTITPVSVVAHNESSVMINLVNQTQGNLTGENVVVSVVQDNVDLNVTGVKIDSEGNAIVTFIPINTEPITVTAVYDGSKVYNGSFDEELISNIDYIGTHITLTSENTTINGTSEVRVSVLDDNGNPVNGTVELTVTDSEGNSAVVLVTVTDGVGSYTYPSVNTTVGKDVSVAGKYLVNDTFGYKESSTETTEFNVAKINTSVNIAFGDIVAHNTSTAVITLSNSTLGSFAGVPGEKLNVTITDEVGNVLFNDTVGFTNETGNIIVSFVPETNTTVNVFAVFNETKVYLGSNTTDTFSSVGNMGTAMTISVENTTINGTTNIVVTVSDNNGKAVTNGSIVLNFSDDTPNMVIPVDGISTEFISEFNNTHVGKNVTVTATFVPLDNGGYEVSAEDASFNVAKLNTTIEIYSDTPVTHNKTTAIITLRNSTANVPNEPIKVTIVDEKGNVLFNDTVNTTSEGNVEVVYTPITGSVINITAEFDGNTVENVYNGSTNSITLSPNPISTKLSLNSTETIIDGTSIIGINVTDDNNNPVNGTVNLTVKDDKGNEYSVLVPVDNGIGEYTYPSNQTDMGKVVEVSGYYVENKTLGYKASPEVNTAFNVEKLNTTVDLVVNNATITNFTVNVTVTGKDTTRTVTNGTLTIFANGVKVGEANVTDGKADNVLLDITQIGDYKLSVEYGGNTVFNENNSFTKDVNAIKINTTTTVEVINSTVGNVTLKAVVKDANDNIVNEGIVNITAIGEDGVEVYVGEAEIIDGKAIINNSTLTGNKEYTFTANYEGTQTYNISNATTHQNIKTRPTSSTLEVLNNTFENVTIKVTVVDEQTGSPITNGEVNITLPNGTIITVKTDENGQNITTFTDIPVGNDKEFNANYLGNDTYSPSDDTNTTNIIKRPSTTTQTVTNNTAGNVTVDVHVTDAENGRNLTEGDVTIYAKLVDEPDTAYVPVGTGSIDEHGMVTIVTNITDIDSYTFKAQFEGNTNYTESNATVDSEAVGRLATIGASPRNTTLGNSTVKVLLNDTVTGEPLVGANVTVILPDGRKVNATVGVDGSVEVPVDLPVGSYKLPVMYYGNDTYNATNTTVGITILPRPSETAGEVINDIACNVTINATVIDAETKQAVPNGSVVAKVNGQVIGTGEVVDGIVIIPTNLDKTGNYSVTLEYRGNENYTASNDTVDVVVVARNSDITSVAGNTTLGNSTVNITLVDPQTNSPIPFAPVVITLPDGTNITAVTDENGTVEVPVDLPVGENTLVVSYPGNETYKPTNTTVTMNILPRPSTITAEVTDNTVDNVTIIATVTDTETGELVPNGTVIAKVNGVEVGRGTVTDGIANIATNIDTIGKYDIELEYSGNEVYAPSKTSLNDVEVVGRTAEITLTPNNTTLGNTTVNVTLVDAETNKAIPNVPVNITVNGTVVATGITDSEGRVTIPVDLPVGEHDITAVFPGNNRYNTTNTTAPITIEPRASQIKAEVIDNMVGNVTITATITDAETGKNVPNGPVEVYANNTLVGIGEVINGKVTIPTNITKDGNYTFNVKYLGNTNYTETEDKLPVEVISHQTEIEPEVISNVVGDTEISIVLTDPDTGDRLINKTVVVTLPDGSNVTAVTDENGVLDLPVDLPAGSNDLIISFPGDEEYKASTTPFTVNVVKRNATLTPVVKDKVNGKALVEITAIDDLTGEPVVNATVELTLPDGTKMFAKTDKNGVAKFDNVPYGIGVTDFDARLVENPVYNEADTNLSIEYSVEPDIGPEVINPVIGETEVEIVLVDPVTGDRLINKTVVVTLPDGSNVTAVTDENGGLDLPVDLPAGYNELVVYFAGDEEYSPSSTTFPVDVVKRNATLTPTVQDQTGANATVVIEARDATTGNIITSGVIELTLPDGTKVTVPLNEEGKAVFENVQLPYGITDLNAILIESPVYNQADANVSIENNEPRVIIIGNWKLIRVNVTVNNSTNNTGNNDVVKPVNMVKKQFASKVNKVNKHQSRYSRYHKYNKHNRHSNRYESPSWRKSGNNRIPIPNITKAQYILLITLYGDYLEGDMSFSDLVAVLKLNGIEIASTNEWDENGVISLTYDDLSEVPDSIEIHDESGHVQDYSSNIDKNSQPSSSGEIDGDDIQVESKEPAHSSSSQSASHSSASSSASNAESASVAGE